MKKITGHQGDVQYKQITSLPQGAVKIENRPIAYGEISGHCHVLTGDVDLFEIDGKLFAVVNGDGATLQHIHESKLTKKSWVEKDLIEQADHKPHHFNPGIYEFGIQNSYNPYTKLMEQVID